MYSSEGQDVLLGLDMLGTLFSFILRALFYCQFKPGVFSLISGMGICTFFFEYP